MATPYIITTAVQIKHCNLCTGTSCITFILFSVNDDKRQRVIVLMGLSLEKDPTQYRPLNTFECRPCTVVQVTSKKALYLP
jgi:hypothetical protein